MKKKIILSALVCAITCVVGFAACGEKHTHDWSEVWSGDATHHWHTCSGCNETNDKAEHVWNDGEITEQATAEHDGVKTFTCAVSGCGKTKTESVTYTPVYTVSDAKWADIMESITNYTVNISVANEMIEIDKLDDWKVISIAPDNEAYNIMFTKEGDKYYRYDNQGGSWIKEECNGNDEDVNIHDYRDLFRSFKTTFGSFTYSEEEKQYSCAALDISETCRLLPLEITNIKVKFENDAIISFTFEVDMDGSLAKYEYGSFGTTNVELPLITD